MTVMLPVVPAVIGVGKPATVNALVDAGVTWMPVWDAVRAPLVAVMD